jgi:3-oxoacyl-[acyl-carrier protein] reductase
MRDKVVVITGAARGFGRAIAERMGRDGCRIVAWDVAPDADQSAAHVERMDVSDPESVEAAAEKTLAAMGRIDVLVNNAGVNGPTVPNWEYPVEDWRRVIAVDLTGVFLCCRCVVPHMRERGEGRIVNIASVAGKEGNANAPAYSAAKGGLIALTKSLGKELAGSGVLVNCVTPAAVETRIFDQMTQAHIDMMKSKIPMGRFGLPKEIAAMVAWLCSEDCSFSTGGVFDLSGGRATY